ncbi:MAG: hypothetical protein M3132_14690 [Actinomycetia bacterium]|nr:hypothetical protein [Actinomycetes bacterium]
MIRRTITTMTLAAMTTIVIATAAPALGRGSWIRHGYGSRRPAAPTSP